jgi:hypothetical protein
MKSSEIIRESVTTEHEQHLTSVLSAIKHMLPIAIGELQLTSIPKIRPVLRMPNDHGSQPSFGCYDDQQQAISVAVADRHPVDILRTLAHELVHWSQRENNQLDQDSGETGSDEENQANAQAGVIMRLYAQSAPSDFDK